MTKQKFLILCITVCTIVNIVKAQSYSIQSLEGKSVKINLNEKASDKSRYVAKISCLTDSVFLVDYNGTKKVRILNKRFLEITYDTRGGSGYQARNTAILSIENDKINVAMLANSFSKALGGDIDGSFYTAKFNITGDNKSNFRLETHIYDRNNSVSYPQKNKVTTAFVILGFDAVQNIFYSANKNITETFSIDDPKTQQSSKQLVKGVLPVIMLLRNSYYYLNGDWYHRGHDNNLFKDYYK